MIVKDNIALLLHSSLRGRAFLQNMLNKKLITNEILLMEGNVNDFPSDILNYHDYYNLYENPKKTLIKNGLNFKCVNSLNCNDKLVIDELEKLKSEWIIYTGGGILRKEILSLGKKIIHVHPGRLPGYRGSTCFYYSIIKENLCTCTIFIMDINLDSGRIIFQKNFKPPKDVDIDYVFDPWMRSETICDFLIEYDFKNKISSINNELEKSNLYYIIHPVLKHLAHLKIEKT